MRHPGRLKISDCWSVDELQTKLELFDAGVYVNTGDIEFVGEIVIPNENASTSKTTRRVDSTPFG